MIWRKPEGLPTGMGDVSAFLSLFPNPGLSSTSLSLSQQDTGIGRKILHSKTRAKAIESSAIPVFGFAILMITLLALWPAAPASASTIRAAPCDGDGLRDAPCLVLSSDRRAGITAQPPVEVATARRPRPAGPGAAQVGRVPRAGPAGNRLRRGRASGRIPEDPGELGRRRRSGDPGQPLQPGWQPGRSRQRDPGRSAGWRGLAHARRRTPGGGPVRRTPDRRPLSWRGRGRRGAGLAPGSRGSLSKTGVPL